MAERKEREKEKHLSRKEYDSHRRTTSRESEIKKLYYVVFVIVFLKREQG